MVATMTRKKIRFKPKDAIPKTDNAVVEYVGAMFNSGHFRKSNDNENMTYADNVCARC